MNIKNMFEKSIDRDIQGVIKVGQSNEENIYQELEEYVVTNELTKHFRDFFSSYKNGINKHTDKMGVWITGFFGSGKSHLLKIFSYLLQNKEVKGKKAIEYFTDGKKIADPMIIADMKLAGTVPTDVILFNIDSKSDSNSKSLPDAIVRVFLKVFNEMQGFCGSRPYIADLERRLTNEGKYEQFKQIFNESSGKEWVDERQGGAFILKHIAFALNKLDVMTEEDTRTWYNEQSKDYHISIEDFGKLVQEYCEKKGNNHHVVFLVDEIGQYIAGNTKLMLNLQTVTEDLGTACGGKAWIVVTSQQDIDSIVHVEGQDFSKIQGRFDTRLNLSSSNVDEVIRKRILEKNLEAKALLEELYNSKESIIKNLITFADPVYKKLYEDANEFANVYPFIPYQFNLLGDVLTSIREHSSSGKHLAEGERSMIALFKESAMAYEEKTEGVLIPFNKFYDALAKFIDHSNSIVINHALENKHLENPFDTDLLKVLFMIKYVRTIKSNVENLTTLLVSHIDQDRVELRKQVEDSLQRLVTETLVQKNGDEYVFLTNEEQEINRAINNEVVDVSEVIAATSNIVFSSVIKSARYSYTSRYFFQFNQKVDGVVRHDGESIGLRLITPYYSDAKDDSAMRMLSMGASDAIIRLPEDVTFLDEIREHIKLQRYMTKNASELLNSHRVIHDAKAAELSEKNRRIVTFVEKAISDSDVYINGNDYVSKAQDADQKLNEILKKQVEATYYKLSYMETEPNAASITSIFTSSNQLGLTGGSGGVNKLALSDMEKYITNNPSSSRMTFKSIIATYTAAPYGFTELDIGWLLGSLFKDNKVAFSISNKAVSILDSKPDELTNYLTKREYQDRLIIEPKKHISEKQTKILKDLMNDLFACSLNTDDDEKAASDFRTEAGKLLDSIKDYLREYDYNPSLPGKDILEQGRNFMEKICSFTMYTQLYDYTEKHYDDLMDYAQDSKDVIDFHKGEQKIIFKKALELKVLYESSKNYITEDVLTNQISNMQTILHQKNPWSSIPMLKMANSTFETEYTKLLGKAKSDEEATVQADLASVNEYLTQNNCTDIFGIQTKYDDIITRLKASNDIAKVKSFSSESATVKSGLIAQIAQSLVKASPEEPGQTPKLSKPVHLNTVVSNKVVQINSDNDITQFTAEIAAALKDLLKNNPGGITVLL